MSDSPRRKVTLELDADVAAKVDRMIADSRRGPYRVTLTSLINDALRGYELPEREEATRHAA
jgi:hypothetical protein